MKRSAAAFVNDSWRALASKEARRSSGGKRSVGRLCMILAHASHSKRSFERRSMPEQYAATER
jgi:hypothetical protein